MSAIIFQFYDDRVLDLISQHHCFLDKKNSIMVMLHRMTLGEEIRIKIKTFC